MSDWKLKRYGAGRLVRVRLDDLEAFLARDAGGATPVIDIDAKVAAIARAHAVAK